MAKKISVSARSTGSTAAISSAPPTADLPLFNWLQARATGVLLHPTAFPGAQGVGVFDAHAVRFLEFLREAGIKYWQLCPLGPTGYGDSPYASFSAFAGNPLLIDLAALVPHDLLEEADLDPLRALPLERVDFGALYEKKRALLNLAYENYRERRVAAPYGDFERFQHEHAAWLPAFAFFTALKDHLNGAAWTEWPVELRDYARAQQSPLRELLEERIERCAFIQYLFFGQWHYLRTEARARGVEIIGDLPIFVALDSADAWANPELFELDPATRRPIAVAGVPPDYFSADGQLWGNPLYAWEAHRADGYRWWIERMRAAFSLYDVVRIDHFRGFDTYWRIPLPAENARRGEWRQGPGLDLFRAFKAAFPQARIIAEDLGDLTESVHVLRRETGLPGMLVLQFAWGGDAKNLYLPHHATPNSVMYPGTHDNDTTLGWYRGASEHERDFVRRYFRVSGDEVSWDFIRASYACASNLAIFPLQDVLSLGSEARFNTPGKPQGNWQWRYESAQLEKLFSGTTSYLRELAQLYAR
ncbi:MAG: 4-alpha-glucanotransferase [Opitutus sp.]|nr:4-alpha-glucanotransferase [Opitutus sp.]